MATSGAAYPCAETINVDDGDVFGCETIGSVMANGAWAFHPHRSPLHHRLIWSRRGGGRVSINGRPVGFGPQTVFLIRNTDVAGFDFLRGTDGLVISVPADSQLVLPQQSRIAKLAQLDHAEQVDFLFDSFGAEHQRDMAGRDLMLRAYLAIMTVWISRLGQTSELPADGVRHTLLRNFVSMVEDGFLKHLQVSDYAERLDVTPTHLSRVCREITGKSASALIQDRLMLESRRALSMSTRRITDVARDLGFSDPAYFTRVFTARSGVSPTEFRKERYRTVA